MIRLVAAELRRLLARRMVLVTAIVLLAGVGLFQLAVNEEVSPPSPSEVAEQQQYFDQAHREWEQNHDQHLKECLDAGETQANCELYSAEPKASDYSLTATPFADIGTYAMLVSTFLALLGSYLVGASFIGAEYSTGSLANWLTFVPQRLRVYGSKLVAVLLACVTGGAVLGSVTLGVAALLTRIHGGDLVGIGRLAAQMGRGAVLAGVAGLLGFALALVTRHTVAALGAVLGYLVVAFVLTALSQDADGVLGWVPPWMPEWNVQAFLQHGTTYSQYVTTTTPEGSSQEYVQKHLSFAHSAVYWLVVSVGAAVGAALVFRRRDVT